MDDLGFGAELIGRRHIAMPSSDRRIHNAFVLPNSLRLKTWEGRMFNIVKRRDFMLAGDLPTKEEEAEKLRDRYGAEYVVVEAVSGRRLTGNTFTGGQATSASSAGAYFGMDYFTRHGA